MIFLLPSVDLDQECYSVDWYTEYILVVASNNDETYLQVARKVINAHATSGDFNNYDLTIIISRVNESLVKIYMELMKMLKIKEGKFYLMVESNYFTRSEGRGTGNAINFFMGQESETDSLISVSTDDARKFAQAIIDICDSIDS